MHQEIQTIILLLVGVLTLTFAILLFVFYRRTQLRNRIATDEKTGDWVSELPTEFEHNGISFRHTFHPAANKAPAYFVIETDCNCGGAFHIKPETWIERFFKWLNISIEVQTGDRTFDEAYYIITEDTRFTSNVLFDSARRGAIQALFQLGFNHVSVNPSLVEAVIEPFSMDGSITDEQMIEAADHLHKLVSGLPVSIEPAVKQQRYIPSHKANPFSGPWPAGRIFIFAFPFVVLLVGAITLALGLVNYPPLDPWTMVYHSLGYSLPVFVFFTWLAIRLLRGRSTSHIDFLLVFFVSLAAIPLTGAGLLFQLNGYLDEGEPQTHLQRVIGKRYTSGRSGKNYYVVVESWRNPGGDEEIRVNRRTWNKAVSKIGRLQITTRPGHFGYEWLQDYELR